MQKVILFSIAFLYFNISSEAQIITSWDEPNAIIQSLEKKNDVPVGFNQTLNEFSVTEDNLIQMESNDGLPTIQWKDYQINDKKIQLPTMYENGIDLYMLIEEGINIYMAAKPSVYNEEIDKDAIKWIRYYAFSKRRYTARLFSRYEKWEKFIRLTMEAEGVPAEIGLLCLIESGCTYNAVSNKGATGMWQFMPATAKELGLIVTENKDERTDPIESTKAAAKYLRKAYDRLGDWTLVIASYNCGIGRTEGISRRHKTKKWNELKSSFPKETQQYIPALQAIHYVWNYRQEFDL